MRSDKAPLGNGALPELITAYAVSSAVATLDYTTAAPPDIPKSPYPRLVVWLRCRACQRGYFTAGALGPQACPACARGRLQPVALWDLRTEPTPPSMRRLALDALVRGEGQP